MSEAWFCPDWPMPPGVRCLITTRSGGVSAAPYDSLNLGEHVGDDPKSVAANRARVRSVLPSDPVWLKQVHGTRVIDLASFAYTIDAPEADAAVTSRPKQVCAIMTADCLPVLFASEDGAVVGAAHAGWRGLCSGVLEQTIDAMRRPPQEIRAYLGPAIGPDNFEVGAEVRDAFLTQSPVSSRAFRPGREDRWMANIYELARLRLHACGLKFDQVFGGEECTVRQRERYFSFRRDKQTGRMASLIWRE